jgi:uncharacterized protein
MSKIKMQNNFVGRSKDLSFLEDLYKKSQQESQLMILYGKVRMGKTQLLKEFFKNKKYIYYLATQGSSKDQLQTAVEIFTNNFGDNYLDKNSLKTWRHFFDYLGSRLQNLGEPVILIFDEFQHLAQSDSSIPSYFQYGWDETLKKNNIFLILSGSSISMMNKYTLDSSSPISRRKTAQWQLESFDFISTKDVCSTSKFENIFALYALVGGVPAYLKELDSRKSIKENIEKKILPKSSFLSLEPELLIASEFHEPKIYLTILKAIGLGRVRYSQIQSITSLANNQLSVYLSNLIDLKLVKREISITILDPEKSKKGVYSINDRFLRFYFSFMFPYMSLIETGSTEILFRQYGYILDKLLEISYQETGVELIKNFSKQKQIPEFEVYGRWFDQNSQIAVVATNQSNSNILFVDSFWDNKPIGIQSLNTLKQKSGLVDWNKKNQNQYFGLISKNGFKAELLKLAQTENILLIEEDRLINNIKPE